MTQLQAVGLLTTKPIEANKNHVIPPDLYLVQAIVHVNGSTLYVTTRTLREQPTGVEYVVVPDVLVDQFRAIEPAMPVPVKEKKRG